MHVSQETVSLSDGKSAKVVMATTGPTDVFALKRDPRLEAVGMVVDAGGLLIDQEATKARFVNTGTNSLIGQSQFDPVPAGLTPDEFADGVPAGGLVIPTVDHWGWQNGCAHLRRDRKVKLPGDKRPVDGYFILDDGHRWRFSSGGAKIGTILGFTATQLVRDAELVPASQWLKSTRVSADARNVFVFNRDVTVPTEFFQLIRPMLPTDSENLIRLWQGDPITVVRPQSAMSEADFQRLQGIIDEQLSGILALSRNGDKLEFEVLTDLPLQRMPLTGIGIDADYQLMVAVVDGRQPDSDGMTVSELAQHLLARGAVQASLGGGGGDCLVGRVMTGGKVLPINIPANRKSDGTFGAMRRSPNALVIQPG